MLIAAALARFRSEIARGQARTGGAHRLAAVQRWRAQEDLQHAGARDVVESGKPCTHLRAIRGERCHIILATGRNRVKLYNGTKLGHPHRAAALPGMAGLARRHPEE